MSDERNQSKFSYFDNPCYNEGYFHDLENWVCKVCGYIVPEQDREDNPVLYKLNDPNASWNLPK